MLARKSVFTIAFAAALAIFASIGWLTAQNMTAIYESGYLENDSHLVIHELDGLLSALKDAETGQRGFIITGEEKYLEPYSSALGVIYDKRTSLRKLTKDNPVQQKRLDAIEPLIQQRLGIIKTAIETRRTLGLQPASRLLAADHGKQVMDEIRRLVAQSQDTQKLLLDERTLTKKGIIDGTLKALKIGGTLGLAILVAVFALLNKELGQRSKTEAELLNRNNELESNRDRQRDQDWIKTGINELYTKLRVDKPLAEITSDTLSFLSGYLNAGAGALYLFEEQSAILGLTASYALTRGKDLNHTIRLGEGLAGEAARGRKTIFLKSIPPDYLAIGSALGDAVPTAVLALPLLHDGRLIGVMEFGSFSELSDPELHFLNQAAEILAIAVSVNQTRQRVNELLQQSQVQEEELRVQQEELQQSNEELEERAQLLERQREQIHQKNKEMEENGREILKKARELEKISTYKSEFLANMSHELRTPLNSLMILSGHLQHNREGNLTAKQVEYAATIKSAGNELLSLINDILDLSKIESGKQEFVYEDTRPVEMCDQIARIFRPVADQKGLAFTTSIEEGMSETVHLDPQRTLQVVKNLLSNAIKFTPAGSVALRVYTPASRENPLPVSAVAFAVTDTGIGIPGSKHELVFQAFQQADGTTSRKFGGTGLGLSISRQLARGMDGEILLTGEEGKGCAFTLYLPISSNQREAVASSKTVTIQPSPVQTSYTVTPAIGTAPILDDRERLSAGDRCILIIEDDPVFARLLMERVRERGFSAVVAVDGSSGIALAEKLIPSAILLDVMLPKLDGWGVMQKLTDNLRTRHIPVQFITCLEERQKALSMGAIGFVTKPVTNEQLDHVFGAIEKAVSRSLKKLLIVEDDQAHAKALVVLLEERDIAITVAQTGAEAIKLLSGEPFDCIVLDLGLADMSGFELLEHIHNMDEAKRIPVIIHTGKELSREDTQKLQRYAESIIIKGAKSPERLLNEVTLFLHVMESELPIDKQRMIRTTLDTEALLVGKKVLLVDDDMRNIFSLSSVLSEKGMIIIEAENGKAALARLEEHPDVNVVLMDAMMPEMDGYEATRRIRLDPRFARLPVIALTAKAMKGDREACLQAGASDYITKPVDLDRLMSLLRVWLYNQG
jgi:CheY-like chemotaxis protein/CHASE3 domain sensor protein/putative methionine-R-sulfoxide reductase with GAF domain